MTEQKMQALIVAIVTKHIYSPACDWTRADGTSSEIRQLEAAADVLRTSDPAEVAEARAIVRAEVESGERRW